MKGGQAGEDNLDIISSMSVSANAARPSGTSARARSTKEALARPPFSSSSVFHIFHLFEISDQSRTGRAPR